MGCWGPNNLDDDTAWDIRDEESFELLKRIVTLAESESGTQFAEYDHHHLFYSFEVLFALDAHRILNWKRCPTPEAALALKTSYLERWSEYYAGAGATPEFAAERRQVIENTFDRFIAGCAKRHAPEA